MSHRLVFCQFNDEFQGPVVHVCVKTLGQQIITGCGKAAHAPYMKYNKPSSGQTYSIDYYYSTTIIDEVEQRSSLQTDV